MRYEIQGDTTVLYDPKGNTILIDTNQLEKVLEYNWAVDNRKGYVRTASRKLGRTSLHRFLLETDSPIDHINRNPRDNRLANLRPCTLKENNRNKGVRKDNASGVKGVTICNNRKTKYKVRIEADGKRQLVGYFETIDEARDAYNAKARELFGEYAPVMTEGAVFDLYERRYI